MSTSSEQYAFLQLLDKTQFNEYKKDAGLVAGIPLLGPLLDESATFDEYEQNMQSLLSKVGYSSDKSTAYQELQSTTSPVAYQYWSQCMATCATQKVGVFAWKESEDKDSIIVVVRYNGGPGVRSARVQSSLDGGQVDRAEKGALFPAKTTILSGGSLSAIVKRTTGQSIKATVSAGGWTADPPIYSNWIDVSQNKGTLILDRPGHVETPAGRVCQTSDWTANNNYKPCAGSGGPCSNDGRYAATAMTITLTAPSGSVLRNPGFGQCWSKAPISIPFVGTAYLGDGEVLNGPPCGLDWFSVDSIIDVQNETSVAGTFRDWTWPVRRELCADRINVTNQSTQDKSSLPIPQSGGQFDIEVHQGYTSAELQYTINGLSGVLKVGDDDQALTLVDTLNAGGDPAHYIYKVK
jgi:hypothetical protein